MVLVLREEESFTMSANVTSPGYQRIALKGYLLSEHEGQTYVAPLIPQLFYGVTGQQLSSWRQNFTQTGSQVILSRAAGGYPEVPREELYWTKVSDKKVEKLEAPKPSLVEWWKSLSPIRKLAAVLFVVAPAGAGLYFLVRKK